MPADRSTPGASPAERAARRRFLRGPVVLGCAVLSLLLSPITAIWAVVVGLGLLLIGLVIRPLSRGVAGDVTSVGLGLLLGVVPYFVLALVQAAG